MGSVRIDEQGLKRIGGKLLETGGGIEYKGWLFKASLGPITKDAKLDEFCRQVGGAKNLPEQLFGDNFLEMHHQESGLSLRLDALGALKQWHVDNLEPFQLKHAQQWRKARAASFETNEIANVVYDWTYTTSYAGTFERKQGGEAHLIDYAEWIPLEGAIDKSTLLQREPILFYAEVPLYESELDDNGSSQLHAKIRVMPSCWYVLQRFFLRIDSHIVRIRDVRILCDFSRRQPSLRKEISHMEGSFDELSTAGIAHTPVAFADADSAAELFQAIAPVGHELLCSYELQYDKWLHA